MRVLFASLFALSSLPAVAGDVFLPGDPNPWHPAGDQFEGSSHVYEFLRPGRNFGNSPELLVVTRTPGSDAYGAADAYLADKQASCEMGHFGYERSSSDDTIYNWEPRGCDFPESELTEVGRVIAVDGELVRISLRLRSDSRALFWGHWLASGDGDYSRWQRNIFGGGGETRVARQAEPSGDCVETGNAQADLDCLLRQQGQQIREMNAINAELARDTAQPYRPQAVQGSSQARAGAATSQGTCCQIGQIRAVHLQRRNPNETADERVTTFKSTDTYVYAVAHLAGRQSGSSVTFRWTKLDARGNESEITSRDTLIEADYQFVYGSLYYNGLTPTGQYRVHIYFDGNYAGSADFEVVAGSSFG